MRVALKIAYEGPAFYGHQRQPSVRTVEGECLRALRAAGVLRDPREAWFRSASRTDRGVSAVGNVIAFQSALAPRAVVGAFNHHAKDVWAWAMARVPEDFHPRHASQRWYRYHVFGPVSAAALRRAGAAFVGEHDFRWFTTDPPSAPMSIDSVRVSDVDGVTAVDIRARSFRRGMVRRIVGAMVALATGKSSMGELRGALRGERRYFDVLPPEPLFLMDVVYPLALEVVTTSKALDEWRARSLAASLQLRWTDALQEAATAAFLPSVSLQARSSATVTRRT